MISTSSLRPKPYGVMLVRPHGLRSVHADGPVEPALLRAEVPRREDPGPECVLREDPGSNNLEGLWV